MPVAPVALVIVLSLTQLDAPLALAPVEGEPAPELAPEPARSEPSSAVRALASIGAGLVATGVMAAGGLYVNSIATCPPGTGGGGCLISRYLLLGMTSLVSTALITAASWLTHRALGGKSGLGWTLLGTLTLVGSALGIVFGVAATGRIEPVPMIVGAGLLSAGAGGLMSEVGHSRAQ